MKKLYFLLLLLHVQLVSSQRIYGTVISDRLKVIQLAKVDFICEGDTVFTTFTDENGKFEYCDPVNCEKLAINISRPRFRSRKEFIWLADGITEIQELNFKLYESREENFCNAAYFEINAYKDIYDFDIENFKYLFEEYPMMCIQTVIALYPGESEKLAAKRTKSFKELLAAWNIDMARISFATEFIYLKPKTDPSQGVGCPELPHISFMVISMEGECINK